MTLSVLGTEVNTEAYYGKTLTIPAGTTGILVLLNTGQSAASTYVRIGGLDLTACGRVGDNAFAVEAWLLDDLSGISGQWMTMSGDAPYTDLWTATIVYIGGGKPAYLDWTGQTGTGGSCTAHAAPPIGNAVGMSQVYSYSGTRTLCSGMTTVVNNTGDVTSGYRVGAAGAALTLGGGGMSIVGVIGAVSVYDSAAVVEPARLGEVVAFRSGLEVTAPTDGTVYLNRLGEAVAFRQGLRIASTAKRQVALVGEGLETPEMTEGGTEGQVLTQHAKRKPTWEDVAGGASALDDLTDVDAAAPDDGNVLAWDDYQQLWVPVPAGTPDLSSAVLDDIGDVDAALPTDGDVLTWDDYQAAWVAAAPTGGGALDDLTDVDAAAPDDGDVLTYDSGTSEWVAAAPAASSAEAVGDAYSLASPYAVVLSASGAIVSTTPTLPAGRYYVIGTWHCSASSGGGVGTVSLQFDGTSLHTGFGRYNTPAVDQPQMLFGYADYAGGSPVIRLYWTKGGGTSLTFGVNADTRFSPRVAYHRIGDVPA